MKAFLQENIHNLQLDIPSWSGIKSLLKVFEDGFRYTDKHKSDPCTNYFFRLTLMQN